MANKTTKFGWAFSPFLFGVGLTAAVTTGMNVYLHHDIEYEKNDATIMQKVDLPFGYTEVEIEENGDIEITRDGFFVDYLSIKETTGDSLVDRVYEHYGAFSRGPSSRLFTREKHGDKYKDKFKAGDDYFAKQMIRFNIQRPQKR